MTLLSCIQTAIFGPEHTVSIEESEAAYKAAKDQYDDAVERGDTRAMGVAWRAMRSAMNDMLRVHSVASRRHPHRAGFSARSRPVGA